MLLIIGFLFMFFFLAIIGILSGAGTVLVDMPSALLILVALIFFLFATKSGKILSKYIKTSFKKDYSYSRTELTAFATAAKNMSKFVIAAGGFGFVCGIMASLANLENREMLGPNLALSLLTFLYGISVSFFIFFPTQAWAENKISALQSDA